MPNLCSQLVAGHSVLLLRGQLFQPRPLLHVAHYSIGIGVGVLLLRLPPLGDLWVDFRYGITSRKLYRVTIQLVQTLPLTLI